MAVMENKILFRQKTAGYIWDIRTRDRFQNPLFLEQYGYKVYSQNDEDGIIHEIFQRIGVTDRRFIEFGVQDGLESNTHCLLHYGWSGLWLEGDRHYYELIHKKFAPVIRSGQLKVEHKQAGRDNVNQIFQDNGFTGEIDLLSIDIDGNDYHVWNAVTCVSPRVVVIEYNAKFPPDLEWCMPYNETYRWNGTDRHGASLKAYENLGNILGYQLAGTNITGVNAFFVRKDLVRDRFPIPASAENLYNPAHFMDIHFSSGHPSGVCLRYTGEGAEGEFAIAEQPVPGVILYDGFHEPEYDADGRFARQWMKERRALIYIKTPVDLPRRLKIVFDSHIPDLTVSVRIHDGTKQMFVETGCGENVILPVIESDFRAGSILKAELYVNRMWSPKEVYGSDDDRILGIAVRYVEVCM